MTTSPPRPSPSSTGLNRRALRIGPFSWTWQPRPLLVTAVLLVVLTATFLRALLAFDDYPMGAETVLRTLLGGGDSGSEFVLFELRMPRALTGLLVGAALGLAGAIMQGITRNPLASPDTLGITWGAAVGAVAVIVLGGSAGQVGGLVSELGVPAGALVCGLVTAVVVFGLAWQSGVESTRLLLVGIATSLFCANLVYWGLSLTNIQDAARAQTWLTGSLHAADWDRAAPAALSLLVLMPMALVAARVIGALGLGDDTARGLGVRVNTSRLVLLLISALLVCVATAATGPITFVALASPQMALRLCRTSHPPLVTSALTGAALTLVADQVAAGLFAPTQLPVGVVTSVLGAPYLMYLIIRRHRESRL